MSYRSVFAPGLFAGRVIIVTGGGSGIGRCTAHELAALGAHVVLVGRKLDKLHGVAGEIVASSFLGERSHYQVRIGGRSEPVFVASSGAAPQGPVMLGWNPADVIALPFEG